jgi:hypothetical protein
MNIADLPPMRLKTAISLPPRGDTMTTIATLAPDGLLLGFEKVATVPPGAVEVPDDCDLKPGRYAWDITRQTFEPTLVSWMDLQAQATMLLETRPDAPQIEREQWQEWLRVANDAIEGRRR